MTLIEVIDAARAIMNEPLDSTRVFPDNSSSFWTDGVLSRYFNMVQQETYNEIVQTFEDYFATDTSVDIVSGTTQYALPANFNKMRRVEDITAEKTTYEIVPISMNDKESSGRRSFLSGTYTPGGYYIKGDNIVFSDTPTITQNSAVRMHYIKTLTDLTAASSVSELPTEHHPILIWGTVKIALNQQQSDNNFAVVEYEKLLSKMRRQVENRQVQRPRAVKRVRGRRNNGI